MIASRIGVEVVFSVVTCDMVLFLLEWKFKNLTNFISRIQINYIYVNI